MRTLSDFINNTGYTYTLTTAAAATLDFGTTANLRPYVAGEVSITVTTDTMAITANRDGETGLEVHVIAADGTQSAATGLASGTYRFASLVADSLTFTKTGTTAVGTVTMRVR